MRAEKALEARESTPKIVVNQYPQFESAVTPDTRSFEQVLKESMDRCSEQLVRGDLRLVGHSEEEIEEMIMCAKNQIALEDKPEPIYRCEADKPEGTRDVDKFLREQQAALWRRE